MTDPTLRDQLLTNKVFQALQDATLDAVIGASRRLKVRAGDTIMAEGDEDRDLVLLVSGTARAYRREAGTGDIQLNNISEGDCLGELAFLDAAPRSASVKAHSDCTVIRIQVANLSDPAIVGDLKGAVASLVVKRARLLSDEMLASMRVQLAARELQNQFGYFLVFTIAIFIVATSIFYLVAEDYVDDVYDPGFSWQTVLLFAVPCIFIIRVLKIPPHALGIKRDGLWRSIWQAVAFCSVLTVPVIIYLAFFHTMTPVEERPVQITGLFLAQYFLHTAVQEVGARGLIQGLFVKFLSDTKGHRAVLLSSTIFASLHVTLGLGAVVLTFFAGILFGYAYHYQKNLAGVIVIHYWFGVLAAVLVAL